MDSPIRVTSGPAIERAGDMAAILTSMQPNEVLFVDEVHRLNRVVEEVLYSAMEDFFLSWMVGKGLAARSVNLRISPFTLVGATTRFSMVSAPLRDRFGSVWRLGYYDGDEMNVIVERSARILNAAYDADGVREIARRSRGTPRVANRLLKRTRDYALVKADDRITGPVARAAPGAVERRPLGPGPVRPPPVKQHHRQIRRRPRRVGYAIRRPERGFRHNNGRMGTLLIATRLPGPHAPGPRSHPPRPRTLGPPLPPGPGRPKQAGRILGGRMAVATATPKGIR